MQVVNPCASVPPDYGQLAGFWSEAFFSVLFFYFMGKAIGAILHVIRSA